MRELENLIERTLVLCSKNRLDRGDLPRVVAEAASRPDRGEEADRPAVINPVSLATSESCRILGIPFNEVHLDADKMAALAAYGSEGIGFDCVMPYFSVVAEAAALSAKIGWGDNENMPWQKDAIYTTRCFCFLKQNRITIILLKNKTSTI